MLNILSPNLLYSNLMTLCISLFIFFAQSGIGKYVKVFTGDIATFDLPEEYYGTKRSYLPIFLSLLMSLYPITLPATICHKSKNKNKFKWKF